MTTLFDVLQKTGLSADSLQIEIQESATLHTDNDGVVLYTRMREVRVEVHLQNAGMDASSLKLLARFPLNPKKTDRQKTSVPDANERQANLVPALLALGHALGNTAMQENSGANNHPVHAAAGNGDALQGIMVTKPLPSTEFFRWMGNK